jgi:ubiquinone/menaquinone biosynthesis C-methylase UbiE
MPEDITHFTDVDRTKDPQFFTRFLDEGNKVPAIVASKPIILEGLGLRGGERVLDVGCGMGADVFEIAPLVGSNGQVTGVDMSAAMIDEARRRAEGRGLPVSFEVGDSQALRFDTSTFDAVRTERMLMHVPDAELALAEMTRVLKPGGRMSVFDLDWETQFCDSPQKETTRKITQSFCDGMKNGWIGRKLPRLFKTNGMHEVTVKPQTVFIHYPFLELLLGGHVAHACAAGVLSHDEADQWWTSLAQAHRAGVFLYGFTALIVAGVKR